MPSVALIGPDGAGKTTLTRMLERSDVLPFRYLYMGINIKASNRALLSSRLAEYVKGRSREREADPTPAAPGRASTGRRGALRAAARLANRLVDAWYRQFVSWYYQFRGFTVLYDRHFVFDFAPEIAEGMPDSVDRRIHRWLLLHLYPRPDLVIFLDAPGELLFARKGEQTVEELERRRLAFLRQGRRLRNFVRVDAARPLPVVYDEVAELVLRFCGSGARDTAVAGRVAAAEGHAGGGVS